jgi:hypothetical protein
MHCPDVSKVWPQARLAAKVDECPQDASHDHGNHVKRCEQEVERLHQSLPIRRVIASLLLSATAPAFPGLSRTPLSIPSLSSGCFIRIKSKIRLAAPCGPGQSGAK